MIIIFFSSEKLRARVASEGFSLVKHPGQSPSALKSQLKCVVRTVYPVYSALCSVYSVTQCTARRTCSAQEDGWRLARN